MGMSGIAVASGIALFFGLIICFPVCIIVLLMMIKPVKYVSKIRSNSIATVIWIPYFIFFTLIIATFLAMLFEFNNFPFGVVLFAVNPIIFLVWILVALGITVNQESKAELSILEFIVEVKDRLKASFFFLLIMLLMIILISLVG